MGDLPIFIETLTSVRKKTFLHGTSTGLDSRIVFFLQKCPFYFYTNINKCWRGNIFCLALQQDLTVTVEIFLNRSDLSNLTVLIKMKLINMK